ncbi:MAG TPA: TIGR02147 family protein [Bdellovibrionales bacterium]|nr:TIGR02147 family protein [Bdellovibrionales bacterium]
MQQQRPDVFFYHDLRSYLADHLAFLKGSKTGFNVAKLASTAKLSKGYLSMVLKGKWKLTPQALQKLLPHLQLTPAEQSYLSLLCLYSNAKSTSDKTQALEQMQRLAGYQKQHPKEALVFKYFSHWYYVAIRELASLPGFQLNPIWIQKKLREPVPLSDIEKAIEFLVENKFLEINSEGKVHPPTQRLECMDEIYKTAMIKFHGQAFNLAIEHVPKLDAAEKNLTAHMCSLSAKNFAKAKKLLEETFDKIVKLSDEDKNPEGVYQFSLLGFTLTDNSKNGRGS